MAILIIDDDIELGISLERGLQSQFEVRVSTSVKCAKQSLLDGSVEVILCDYNIGLDKGTLVLDYIERLEPKPIVIMMTAFGTKELAIQALNKGVFRFLEKPLRFDSLIECIKDSKNEFQIRAGGKKIKSQKIKINSIDNFLLVGELNISVTSTELKLFAFLLENYNLWTGKEAIQGYVWGKDISLSRNALDTHLTNLKKKLAKTPLKILSKRGNGVRLTDEL